VSTHVADVPKVNQRNLLKVLVANSAIELDTIARQGLARQCEDAGSRFQLLLPRKESQWVRVGISKMRAVRIKETYKERPGQRTFISKRDPKQTPRKIPR
jgi:hypothetical protein